MPKTKDNRPFDLVPVLTLVGLLLVFLLGWWLFPYLQRSLSFQDCVATGRANCAADPANPTGR